MHNLNKLGMRENKSSSCPCPRNFIHNEKQKHDTAQSPIISINHKSNTINNFNRLGMRSDNNLPYSISSDANYDEVDTNNHDISPFTNDIEKIKTMAEDIDQLKKTIIIQSECYENMRANLADMNAYYNCQLGCLNNGLFQISNNNNYLSHKISYQEYEICLLRRMIEHLKKVKKNKNEYVLNIKVEQNDLTNSNECTGFDVSMKNKLDRIINGDNSHVDFTNITISNIKCMSLKCYCILNKTSIHLWSSEILDNLIVDNLSGYIIFHNTNNLVCDCEINSGTIVYGKLSIFNDSTNTQYDAIVINDNGTLRIQFADRPVLPITVPMSGSIHINLYISNNVI